MAYRNGGSGYIPAYNYTIPAAYWLEPGPAIVRRGDEQIVENMVNGTHHSNSGEPENKRQRIDGDDQTNTNAESSHDWNGRQCFVTVGATAGFPSLIEEITTPAFLNCLIRHGYDRLTIQCGPDYQLAEQRIVSLGARQTDFQLAHQRIVSLGDDVAREILITMFAYTDAMVENIYACRQDPAGCVISHAGKRALSSHRNFSSHSS
jgi:beta-1,4-N-acetylglucosaminyltransferase